MATCTKPSYDQRQSLSPSVGADSALAPGGEKAPHRGPHRALGDGASGSSAQRAQLDTVLLPDQPDPLDGGQVCPQSQDPERYGQRRDAGDVDRVQQETGHDDHDALGTGQDPAVAFEAEALGARPDVTDQEGTAQRDHDQDRLQDLVLQKVVDEDGQVDDSFRVAVDGGVEKGAVAINLAGGPGQGAVQDVEESGEEQNYAGRQEVTACDQGRSQEGDA